VSYAREDDFPYIIDKAGDDFWSRPRIFLTATPFDKISSRKA
jgi:hypothetical protein